MEKTGNEPVCPKETASFGRIGQSGPPPEVIPNTSVGNIDLINHGKNISYARILYLNSMLYLENSPKKIRALIGP